MQCGLGLTCSPLLHVCWCQPGSRRLEGEAGQCSPPDTRHQDHHHHSIRSVYQRDQTRTKLVSRAGEFDSEISGEVVVGPLVTSLLLLSLLALYLLYVRRVPARPGQSVAPVVHIISTPHTSLATTTTSQALTAVVNGKINWQAEDCGRLGRGMKCNDSIE